MLLELLVALVLLAALATMMPGAFRLAQRAVSSEVNIEETARRSAVRNYLARTLARAMPVLARQERVLAVAFSGTADRVDFVTSEVAGPYGAGIYRHALHVESAVGVSRPKFRLVLELSRFWNSNEESDIQSKRLILLEATSPMAFRFYGADGRNSERSWQAEWQKAQSLPDLVELTLPGGDDAASGSLPLVVKLQLGRRG